MINVEDIDHSEYSSTQLLAIPALLLILTFAIIGATFMLTGNPVNLGFQFAGGASVQIDSGESIDQIRQGFASVPNAPAPDNVRSTGDGFVIRYKGVSDSQIDRLTDYVNSNYDESSISTVSPAYGQSLLGQSLGAVLFAFIIMSITIFAFFRTFIPSVAVVLSAFSDMLVPIGVMNLLGIDVSLATIPAILLLIGYSIDSDILLTRNVLKGRRSEFYDNVKIAMRTGITMTTTSMSAMAVMAVISHIFSIFILRDIGIILFVGLGTDILNTYLMNVALLRWHVKPSAGGVS